MNETAARPRLSTWATRILAAATVLLTTVVGFATTAWAGPELGC